MLTWLIHDSDIPILLVLFNPLERLPQAGKRSVKVKDLSVRAKHLRAINKDPVLQIDKMVALHTDLLEGHQKYVVAEVTSAELNTQVPTMPI